MRAATLLAYGWGVSNTSGNRPWFWEGHVQSTLAAHLAADGWQVLEAADTESKAAGIDLLARQDQRWLAIEVKGYPNTTYEHGPNRGQPKPTQPSNQARQWFSHALLGMMLLRHRRPDAEVAICLPAFKTYESLIDRTRRSFELLGFGVYLVADDGSVELIVAHQAVDEAQDGLQAGASRPQAPSRGAAAGRSSTTLGTCRDGILAAFTRLERRHGRDVFAPSEIIQEVLAVNSRYPEQTIRTEIVSRMCTDAPKHHAVVYEDLQRVGRGKYRRRPAQRTLIRPPSNGASS
jgi:hypothetical protein